MPAIPKASARDIDAATHGDSLERRQRRSVRQHIEPVDARSHGAGLPRLGRRARTPSTFRACACRTTSPGATDTVDDSNAGLNSNAGLHVLAAPPAARSSRTRMTSRTTSTACCARRKSSTSSAFRRRPRNTGQVPRSESEARQRRRARVTYRAGYYENGGETSAERALTTAEVIVNDIPQDDVHVAAFAAPFPGRQRQLAGAGHPRHQRRRPDERSAAATSAAAEIFVYAFDDEGVVRDRLYQRLSLDMKKVGDRLKTRRPLLRHARPAARQLRDQVARARGRGGKEKRQREARLRADERHRVRRRAPWPCCRRFRSTNSRNGCSSKAPTAAASARIRSS